MTCPGFQPASREGMKEVREAISSPLAVPVEVCMEKPYCIVILKYSTSEVTVSLLLEAGNVP
jgi:hypothetical protein